MAFSETNFTMSNDLFRNLGLGFILGAIGVVISNPALIGTLV